MTTAKEALDLRLAKGEISEPEYEKLLARISQSDPPATPSVDPVILNSVSKETMSKAISMYNNFGESIKSSITRDEFIIQWNQHSHSLYHKLKSGQNTALAISAVIGLAIFAIGQSTESFFIGLLVFLVASYFINKIIENSINQKMTSDLIQRITTK